MSIDISAFRQIATDRGYVKASDEGKGLTRFGVGFFGRIAAWLRGPSAAANKALKADFLTAVKRTYGDSFLGSQEIDGLRNATKQSKPLSARLVRHIIAKGDEMLVEKRRQVDQKFHIDGKEVTVKSSYKDLESMRQAADRFMQQARFDAKGSGLMSDMVAYIDKPSPGKLAALSNAPGGASVARFVEAYGVGDSPYLSHMLKLVFTPAFSKRCVALRIDPFDISTAVIANVQQPSRLAILCKDLAQHANESPAQFKGIVKEMVSYVPNQALTLERGIKALSHPKISHEMPEQDVQALALMKAGLTAMLNEVVDPDGPCQQLLAYATVAAMDLGAAQHHMKSVPRNG